MQVNVKDVEYIIQSIQILNQFNERIEVVSNEKINQIVKILEGIIQELNLSNNFLSVAKVQETQKLAVLTQKEAEVASALQQEVAALASGNPTAIAIASVQVSQKSYEVHIANQDYQRAKRNRINIEKRVELVNKAKAQKESLLEETKRIFRANISNINILKNQISSRLENAYRELHEYFNYSGANNAELDHLVSIIKSNEKNRINKQSTYSLEVNKNISTTDELRVYQNENLEEDQINERVILKDNRIDLNLKDAKGRTNRARMEKGLAPLDEDGRPYNLHHIGQKSDSPLAELKDNVHKQNDIILHDKSIPTEVHGGDINWDRERANHWKQRAKKIKEEMEEEYV
ncbi:MAG TPA: hypothetical protein ENK66_01075 [Arcobacter sp.]|nr:hypothetical protein [Arcobacter sp.]